MPSEGKPHGESIGALAQPGSELTQTAQGAQSNPGEMIYEISLRGGPLRQGEILSNVTQLLISPESLKTNTELIIDSVIHPYAIALTQECELFQDFTPRSEGQKDNDKIIPNILFCEVVTADELRGRADIKSDIWKRIRQNKDQRYQFLEKVDRNNDLAGLGLPELGIDFKRYFTIPTAEIYFGLNSDIQRRCRLVGPYLWHFTGRFFSFQSRVALPAEHRSD